MDMAIIRKRELAAMAPETMKAKLSEVEGELYRELGVIKSGGRAQNTGRVGELKRTVARLKTKLAQKAKEIKSIPASAGKVEVKKSA
jgi:large subunit ribosomal protein L29